MTTHPKMTLTAHEPIRATYQAAKLITANGKVSTAYSDQGTRTVVTRATGGYLGLRYVPRQPRIPYVDTGY